MANHKGAYSSWQNMKARCYQKSSPSYVNYGGRGITVCDEWKNSFDNFLRDMGDRPEGHSIDRINNDGNYEPSNCRWVTLDVQSHNRRPFSSSGYKGVYLSGGKYTSKIKLNDTVYNLGSFDTVVEAAEAYNRKAIELYGCYASLNDLV